MGDLEPGRYRAAPVNARLAVASTGVERLIAVLPTEVPGLRALVVEHLWQWLSVDESTFEAWAAFDSPLRSLALGDGSPDLARLLVDAAPDLPRLVVAVVEMVEGNLYAAVDEATTQQHFSDVLETLDSHGVVVPPPESVAGWPRQRFGDWGDPLTAHDMSSWRARLARA